MKIGYYDVELLNAGLFRLDGGSMFGVVPKVLWQKKKPADERNRIQMCTNLLLLRGAGRVILIDTGNGTKFDDKFADIYAIDYSSGSLGKGLSERGLTGEDITDVIITHLHFDHVGGCTVRAKDGTVAPAFPRATYHVLKSHFDWARSHEAKDRPSYLEENFLPLKAAGQLVLLEETGELFPGVELIRADGHTVGNLSVLIHGSGNGSGAAAEGRKVFYAGEMIPTSAHVPEAWIMGYDLQPLVTLEEKRQYLPRAAAEGWFVVFMHDPVVPCGTIGTGKKGFELKKAVEL